MSEVLSNVAFKFNLRCYIKRVAADKAAGKDTLVRITVGTDRLCLPRHRSALDSRREGLNTDVHLPHLGPWWIMLATSQAIT